MEAFSNLLLGLYRHAQTIPPAEFQARALESVGAALAFDSAMWGTGEFGPGGAIPHAVYLYRQPPAMMEDWERIKHLDLLSYEAFSRSGQTINAALSHPDLQARVHPEVMAHIKRYGMENTLATIITFPVLRLFTAVSFYRAHPAQVFTEAERLFIQNLVPHLDEAWNTNRFNFIHSPRRSGAPSDHARAIFDKKGVLYNANQNFENLMLAEWPDWVGPQLPRALLNTLPGEGRHQYSGQDVVATLTALNDMLLLNVRKKTTMDHLSPREFEVAKRFGQGMSYRKIADELHIAPVTVRNHLQAIYATLGVSNKVEMARMIFEAED